MQKGRVWTVNTPSPSRRPEGDLSALPVVRLFEEEAYESFAIF